MLSDYILRFGMFFRIGFARISTDQLCMAEIGRATWDFDMVLVKQLWSFSSEYGVSMESLVTFFLGSFWSALDPAQGSVRRAPGLVMCHCIALELYFHPCHCLLALRRCGPCGGHGPVLRCIQNRGENHVVLHFFRSLCFFLFFKHQILKNWRTPRLCYNLTAIRPWLYLSWTREPIQKVCYLICEWYNWIGKFSYIYINTVYNPPLVPLMYWKCLFDDCFIAAAKSAQTLQVLVVGNSTGLLFWYPTMDGFLSGKSM